MHGLRLPLYLALVVSPCILFLPTEIHKHYIARLTILEVRPYLVCFLHILNLYKIWQGLGGDRPSRLLQVEHLLWTAVFDLATSKGGYTMICTVIEQIQKIVDESLDVRDKDWFGFPAETPPLSQEDSMMQIDGEHAGDEHTGDMALSRIQDPILTDNTNNMPSTPGPSEPPKTPQETLPAAMDVDSPHPTPRGIKRPYHLGSQQNPIDLTGLVPIDGKVSYVVDDPEPNAGVCFISLYSLFSRFISFSPAPATEDDTWLSSGLSPKALR